MPTSARTILHHTDQKGPNIMHPSVRVLSDPFSVDMKKKGQQFKKKLYSQKTGKIRLKEYGHVY